MIVTARYQLVELVTALAESRIQRRKQDESLANTWRKRGPADGLIDWRMSARSIYNLVRSLARPYPGAEFVAAGGKVKVWRAEVVADAPANAEPGKVLSSQSGRPVVRCGDQAICLIETEPAFIPDPGTYL